MMTRLILTAIATAAGLLWVPAQPSGLMQQLPEEEKSAIEAIALYPQEERATVLNAAMYPEVLARMQNIRRRTEAEFIEMIAGLSEENQEKVYNLFRYPELMESLCERDKLWDKSALDALMESYPQAIYDDAAYLNDNYFGLIKDIQVLYQDAERAFEEVLSNYPEGVKSAYRKLSQLPEVVNILAENMNLTVLLGDIYRRQPTQLEKELDSLNVVIAEQQAQEVNEWKQQLEEQPEVMYEYEQAAREFAEEQGYDDEFYNYPVEEYPTHDIYVHHSWKPYPYWFGWPYWYTYESWYPYPWWYHWGYYYGPRRMIVVIGLPSNIFIHWHFRHHRHFYYYPHFTNHVINHYYYGPRSTGSSIHTVVSNWEREHRRELPADWLKEDGNRVNRIREYGKFKMDYEKKVRQTSGKAPSQRAFLKKHARSYPTLKPVLKEQPEPARTQPESEKTYQPKRDYRPDKKYEPRTYEPREKVIERREQPRRIEIDRAKERHENTWKRIKREPQRPRTAPKRTEPQKAPRQRTSPAPKQKQQTKPRGERRGRG